MEENILIENIIEKDLSPDKYRLVHNKIKELEQENKYLEDKLNTIIKYIKSIDYDYLDESNQHDVVEYLDSILNRLGEEK